MKPEAPELSALFDHARHGDEPSEDDRRRVSARVAERLAVGAGLGAATLTLTRFGWASSVKTWGVVAVVLAGAGSGVRPSPVVPQIPSREVSEAPAPIVEKREVSPPPVLPKRERAVAPATSQPTVATDEPGRLARETAALRAANEALRGGAPARALTLLDAFARDFPGGVLTEEALATRVSALCSLGRVAEARSLGTRFVKRYPRSPVAARVRGSCAMPEE
jgi:hypothetical protein